MAAAIQIKMSTEVKNREKLISSRLKFIINNILNQLIILANTKF